MRTSQQLRRGLAPAAAAALRVRSAPLAADHGAVLSLPEGRLVREKMKLLGGNHAGLRRVDEERRCGVLGDQLWCDGGARVADGHGKRERGGPVG